MHDTKKSWGMGDETPSIKSPKSLKELCKGVVKNNPAIYQKLITVENIIPTDLRDEIINDEPIEVDCLLHEMPKGMHV